jgi:hypothetical protein
VATELSRPSRDIGTPADTGAVRNQAGRNQINDGRSASRARRRSGSVAAPYRPRPAAVQDARGSGAFSARAIASLVASPSRRDPRSGAASERHARSGARGQTHRQKAPARHRCHRRCSQRDACEGGLSDGKRYVGTVTSGTRRVREGDSRNRNPAGAIFFQLRVRHYTIIAGSEISPSRAPRARLRLRRSR